MPLTPKEILFADHLVNKGLRLAMYRAVPGWELPADRFPPGNQRLQALVGRKSHRDRCSVERTSYGIVGGSSGRTGLYWPLRAAQHGKTGVLKVGRELKHLATPYCSRACRPLLRLESVPEQGGWWPAGALSNPVRAHSQEIPPAVNGPDLGG